jgi:hypothetical protein
VPTPTAAPPGRVALDAVFVPTAFPLRLGDVAAGAEPDSAVAEWTVGDHILPVEVRVAPDGRCCRWHTPLGHPNGRPWAPYPCGRSLDDERDFAGTTLPTRLRVGSFFGTSEWAEGEFLQATITDTTLR